jgi:hypothetical protein
MNKLFYLAFILILFSCSQEREIIQGKLEDFVTGEVSFERDEKTGFMGFQGSVKFKGKEAVYTEWNGIFQFLDPQTGKKLGQFQIPKDGPMALKGGYEIGKAFDGPIFVATNSTGNTNFYQNDTLVRSFKLDMETYEPKGYLYFPDSKHALHKLSENEFEITFDPFDFMAFRNNKDGFDLEFGSWIGKFDSLGNWLCKSDFKAPYDESYANSISSTELVRLFENNNSWAMFPFSDSLYLIKDCQIVDRKKLEQLTPINYFPEKFIQKGNSAYWENIENAAMNSLLMKDSKWDLRVRFALINQIKTQPEIIDPRQRMFLNESSYLILVYDNLWNLKGEVEITYSVGTKFENMFVSSGNIFINKPEQKSEDEYEFYKIDLAQFAD